MMMMSPNASGARNNTRFPFTPTQWQELEHQALIFKYMASGNPIPHELLSTIKTSSWDPLSNLLHLHPPQQIGWNHYHMGYGRKIDPEPGRCRRTDGKKWRCSKEAYPDSKYCERHMHRGRNRSRKPVETNLTSSTTSSMNDISLSLPKTGVPISSNTRKSPQNLSPSPYSVFQAKASHQFGPSLSSQNGVTTLNSTPFLYPHSRPSERNYSYVHGIKEEAGEHPNFLSSSSSGTMRSMSGSSLGESSWLLDQPLAMNKQRTCSALQNGYPFTQPSSREKQDLGWGEMMKMGREEEPQKVMHHFFDEGPRNKDSWEETQLSISMPRSSHEDFFRAHNEK
ncbi:growth-regulating factor 1-like isoform X2 [Daucus carota subsp. sativus]|uniref:growth-regulating factor 1-like isoform X2 n=1 Tax=Daucus carota subsp. sativus TaxID=79200 RepID=UPI0007EF067D|nr:PREDICTED: growth-regulating factor 1-like isoform X2 [Daucus carota subsp. sativus]